MKMVEINTMTRIEIERELEDTLEAFANLRFQQATHELDNPVKLRYLRKDIARLKTVLKEFELGNRQAKDQDQEKKKDSKRSEHKAND
jgi:large subunit ribosomal protein L29